MINIYLPKCPLKEGKITEEKFSHWTKNENKKRTEVLVPFNEVNEHIECTCIGTMKKRGGYIHLNFLSRLFTEGLRRDIDYACVCRPIMPSKKEIEEIKKYFGAIEVDETDV